MTTWKTALSGLALLGLALLGACHEKERGFSASGTFEAVEVEVGNLLTGRLIELNKREGDTVAKDELLAQIDCEKLQLERELTTVQFKAAELDERLTREKIAAARISLANDTKSQERFEALVKSKTATQQQLDDIRTRVKLDRSQLDVALKELDRPRINRDELEARLRLLDRQIEDSRVVSPIDGEVTERYVEPGEVLTTGQRILRLADLSRLEIRVYLPTPYLGQVKLGQELKLHADGAPGREFAGTVVWISPEAEFTPKSVQTPEARAELVYAVKLSVPNPDGVLKIGMPADVFFE
ncbi:efflux RND transporter periplasmic adaptor subunit [bacterium]|nr:efflux RND transporter periplasmic adaptor subunit [bacterium]